MSIEIDHDVTVRGDIEMIVEYDTGIKKFTEMRNTILTIGRWSIAKMLANEVGDTFQYYVNRMIFGTNGTQNTVPKYVDAGRTALFGMTALSKPVIAAIDDGSSTTAVFTSVISFAEANDLTLNEMALQMASGDLYSMRSFPDLNKSSNMQVTFNWRINFV
jgi:hypothetical protein